MAHLIIALSLGFMIGCIASAILSCRSDRYSVKDSNKRLKSSDTGGVKFLCIGGGTGLSTLLAGLKGFSRNISAVVAVTDEGGSSGRLRQEWGVLPPGDIRNCLVALAEDGGSLNRILNFRFDRGELAGHSLGNLMLLAASEMTGDFGRAVEEMSRLLAIRGRVMPVTTENVQLCGETYDGQLVQGEMGISDNGFRMKRLWLEPPSARSTPGVLRAVADADLIVMGPGSLFTSILPDLLIAETAAAIRETQAPKVYVANLMTQSSETEGMNITAHIDWIASVLGRMPDVAVVNEKPIPEDFLKRYRDRGSVPLYLSKEEENYLERRGCRIMYADLVNIIEGKYLRHHSQNLAEILSRIADGI